MNSGCCYDGRIGICHSCDAHEHEWCQSYGGEDVKTCVGFAGCTMDYDKPEYPKGICQSSADPADFIEPEITCCSAQAPEGASPPPARGQTAPAWRGKPPP